jgi:hypothetical protein
MTIDVRPLSLSPRTVLIDRELRPTSLLSSELPTSRRWRSLLLASGAYAALSIFVWLHVWTGHPGSTTTCGCGDSAGAIWDMEWPAYALTHGFSLLYSSFMNHPTGINLMANPGVLTLSLPLAPLTWLFGPVASLNFAFTLAPLFSAVATYVLLRRWVSWAPAAFIGGLFYGFCPFILVSLSQGWVNLGMAPIPPLILLCLDELLFRQRRKPTLVGVALGLLVALQFFLSTEILLMVAIVGVGGVALVIAYGVWRSPGAVMRHAPPAAVGLGVGALTSLVLLAFPTWFAMKGPARLSGLIWPNGFPQRYSNVMLNDFVHPAPASESFFLSQGWHQQGGYQGTPLSFQYFGIGVLIVILVGLVIWRRDIRLWFFGAITMFSVALSIGGAFPHPWGLFAHLPLFENILPGRFVLITYLSVGAMLSLTVDHCHRSVDRFRAKAEGEAAGRSSRSQWLGLPSRAGAIAAVIVAAIGIAPPAAYLASTIPITTQTVVLPTWFRDVAPHLNHKQVLLAFPTYFSGYESPSAWQAVDHMSYSMVNIGGPAGFVVRAGKERAGAAVIADTSQTSSLRNLEFDDIAAVRNALNNWGVTVIVIPDQPDLPLYDQTPSVVTAAALMTAATGEEPIHQADAWVWKAVRTAPRPVQATGAQLQGCTADVASRGVVAVDESTACILRGATP